jgi:SAM-dependent methyltransferase
LKFCCIATAATMAEDTENKGKDAVMTTDGDSAADRHASRVDAVVAQRTRLRGRQPPGDLFAGLPSDHPLVKADPRRPLDPNLEIIASYIQPDDVIIDVGGGAGRVSLPLALRCREVINVEPSAAMGAGFRANAAQAGIVNARIVEGDWLAVDPPAGTVALVNHVTYLTREIVPFIERLERAGRRRVLITVNSPPPPSWQRVLFQLVHGEAEEIVPGHAELVNVLWELGILPDIRVLPLHAARPIVPAPTREAAIAARVAGFGGDQWSFWPLEPDLERRLRSVLETRFDELFAASPEGFVPRFITPGREILITWEPAPR